MASWASVIMTKILKKRMVCKSLRRCFGRGVILSGQVKIIPGEWSFSRVTRWNGECCQNLVSNTGLNIFIYIIGSNAVSIVLKMTLDQVSDMCLVLSN